jgi:hypothetical protein
LELLGVADGEAPLDNDEVGDAVVVEERVGEPDNVDVGVGSAVVVLLALLVELGVPVPEGVCDAVMLEDGVGVGGALALLLALAPLESDAVGDTVADALRLTEPVTVCVGLLVGDTVRLGVLVRDGVSDALEDGFPVSVPLTDALGVSLAVRDALSPRETEPVVVGVALLERLSDGDNVGGNDAVADFVSELEAVAVGVGEPDGVPLPLCVGVPLDESDTLDVIDALAPFVTEPVGVEESVAGAVELGDGVTGGVPEGVGVDELVLLLDDVDVDETDDDGDSEPVCEEDAPSVSDAVGVRLRDDDKDEDDEGVCAGVGVPVIVGLGDGVALPDGTDVILAVPESEPEDEGLAPRDIVAVGERETEREREKVELGVIEGVAVPDGLELPVAEALDDAILVILGVSEMLGVHDALAPDDKDDVGEPEIELLRDTVDDGVDGGEPVGVDVVEPVGVTEGVDAAVEVAVSVKLDVAEEVIVGDGEILAEAPRDRVAVGVPEVDDDSLCVDERLSLLDGVWDGVTAPEPVPVVDVVALTEGVALAVIVVEPVPELEGVFEGLAPSVSDAVGVCVKDAESVDVEVGVGGEVDELDGDALAVGELLLEAVLDGLGVRELLGVAVCDIDGVGVVVELLEGDAPGPLVSPLLAGVCEGCDRDDADEGTSDEEAPGEFDGLLPAVCDEDGVTDADAEGEPVSVPVVVAEGVPLALTDEESDCVEDAEGEPVPVPDGDAVGVPLDDDVSDALPESEPVFEGLAPFVNEDVGDLEAEGERDAVDEVVLLEVLVGDAVPVTVGVTLLERVDEVEPVSELLGDSDALAPMVTEAVALADSVELAEVVDVGVPLGVLVGDGVGDPEPDCEGVCGGVSLAESVVEAVVDDVSETEGVSLAEAPGESDAVGEADTVEERLCVVEPLSLPEGV